MTPPSPVEKAFEKLLFGSRWLMAPMYLGLVVSLVMLVFIFGRDIVYYVPKLPNMNSEDVILVALTLIDITLAANLVLIVMFAGYENFVSRLDVDSEDRPGWMGKVDFGGLKMKLIASIVAISGISLLKRFMAIGDTRTLDPNELYWMVVIHITFVLSGVLMALMDWFQAKSYSNRK
ncbi:TIGR00645 family protein [Xinfangfangia sp. D13-10-4-6]|uniref:TIGR00645 family protein n=1 Tax=Pseudogemmobacter hezensis TaxID=2737662 RepID=UPI0015516F9C|nr:TIGR00645 family protein [Pseudogemmobacter hezensis]NPD17082.1 TIGR00645 family protein [Pseudogemmobacter hezensis]